MVGINKTIALLLLTVIFVSCGKNQKTEIEDYDASVQLTEITAWEIDTPHIIPHPRYSGVLNDGSLILIDISLNTINHFDASGNLIEIFGGAGRGPGEYSSITHAAVSPDGRVAVADVTNARITIQDVVDDTVVSIDLDNGWHTRLSWISEGLIITNNPFRVGAESRGDSVPGDIIMRIYDPVTGLKEQFFHLELELEDLPPEQISCTFCEFRFNENFTFFTSPEDTSYRIYEMDPHTRETTLFTRPGLPAVKLTDKEQEEWREEMLQAPSAAGLSMDVEPPVYKRRFVDFFPDHLGRLWAQINISEGGPSIRFDIFSPDAEYIGSLDGPEGAASVEFISGGEILIQHESDNLDLWKAVLYKIVG